MNDNKRILNIDESVLRLSDHRKRGWQPRVQHNQTTNIRRLPNINIIATTSNYGELFYTVNQGKTNGLTFILYVTKLIEHLNNVDKNWRTNTIIMIDNAPYHRSAIVKDQLKRMKVPLLYLGPYQFRMAPVEIFFSYLKCKDLNPLNSRIPTQGLAQDYVRELAMHISRLPRDWIRKSFIHMLTFALSDLSLCDI